MATIKIPRRLINSINRLKEELRDSGKGKLTNPEISEEALNQMFDVLDSCDEKTKTLIRAMFCFLPAYGRTQQSDLVAFEAENSLKERAKKYAKDYYTSLSAFGTVACRLWRHFDVNTNESAPRKPVKFPENDVG